MSESVRPHRWQPTRLPHPWDSPGKNAGVGCRFLLQSMKVKSEREVTQLCPTLRDPMDWSLPVSSVHGIFQVRVLEWDAMPFSRGSSQPGIKPGSLQSPALAGGFFTTAAAAAKSLQSCPSLCDPIDGSPQGSPIPGILQARTLEWVAISFSNA